ncbi:MAG TPA: MFS transporter [Actinocrinis sp.]|jgi:EmrB/QacA subfamily drug resistance transporter
MAQDSATQGSGEWSRAEPQDRAASPSRIGADRADVERTRAAAVAPAGENRDDGHPRRWIVLGVLVFALLVVVLDNTVLNVALKTISEPAPVGIGASQSDLEWAINSYTLIFAGLLFTWGLLADRLGRKRILLLGMLMFGLSSLLCAYCSTPAELIAARAAMGLSGAAIMPPTLAVISNVFPRREQGKAIGIWSGSVGLAIAIGPVVGGALLDNFWWGSVFLINVPIVAIALVVMIFIVPESKNPRPGRLDPIGVLLSTGGLVSLVYGIIEGGDNGDWSSPTVWGTGVGGLALLTCFVLWEQRVAFPALDVRLFRNRPFSAAVISVGLSFFALMGGLFFFSFYLQSVRGYSPLHAGLWLLPFAATQVIFSPLSAGMVRRFGARAVACVGLTLVGVSFLLFQLVTVDSAMWIFGLVASIQGMAMANVMPPATTTVMGSLPRERAGVGSSINNTVRQVGGALGIAVLGTVLTSVYRGRIQPLLVAHGVPSGPAHDIAGSIQATQAFVAQQQATRPQVRDVISPANDAFLHAMHITTLVAACVMFFAAVVVLAWLPRRGSGQPSGAGDPAHAAESVAA